MKVKLKDVILFGLMMTVMILMAHNFIPHHHHHNNYFCTHHCSTVECSLSVEDVVLRTGSDPDQQLQLVQGLSWHTRHHDVSALCLADSLGGWEQIRSSLSSDRDGGIPLLYVSFITQARSLRAPPVEKVS